MSDLPNMVVTGSEKDIASSDTEQGVVDNKAQTGDLKSSRKITGFKWVLVVFSMLSSIFLFSLDNTVLADLVPIIVNDFHHVDQLAWLSVGFTIGAVVLALSFGKLYATFDAKWLFIGSSVLFQASSILCGAAPTMAAEIVGRVFAGVGGNGMYLGCLTLMITHTTEKERSGYLATIGIFWGLGTVLGPVVGGGFAVVWWPWAFFINPMFGVLCILICILCVPRTDPKPGIPHLQRFAEFDFVGSILITAAITILVVAINFGGTSYAWNGGETIALFIISGALFIAFGFQQVFCLFTRVADRIFPVQFMNSRNAILLFICAAAINTAAFVPIYYIPIYFQFTRGDTPLESAVRLLPLIFILSATIFANGQLMVRFGSFQDWYIGGSILTLVGGVLISRINVNTSTSAIYGYEVLLALGSGAFVQAGYTVIYFFVKPEDGAYGVSFMSLGGMALGLSIAGAVFVNKAVAGLASVLPNTARAQLLATVSGTSNSVFNNLPSETKALALNVIVAALSNTFILVYVAASISLLCSCIITRLNMGKVMAGAA